MAKSLENTGEVLMFPTIYTKVHLEKTNPGNKEKVVYELLVDSKTGVQELQKVGVVNIIEEIQAHRDSVDLNKIIERYENGETGLLDKKPGLYGDYTNMPKNMAEMQDFVSRGTAWFENLPLDVRKEFNNSPSEFFSLFGTERYLEIMKKYNNPEKPEPPKPEEIKKGDEE